MSSDDLTRAVAKLTEVFGSASQNTLGSAVFQSDSKVDLETLDNYAKSVYQHFVGKAWEDFGPENWNKTWQMLYRRPEGSTGSILEELKSLGDAATELAASQVTENHDDPTAATQGLTGVFDSPSLTSVSVYRIGDSEAITGVLLAGLMPTENAIALVFLMD
ncbi:MAG: hypothetical protein ACK6DQ_11270 [Planctomycetota bacterium]